MKKLILKVFVALVSVAFAALLIFVSVPGLTFNSTVKAAGVPIIGLHCLVLTLASLRRPFRARGRSATVFYIWCALVLVTLPFAFMKSAFGVGDVASILITVAENRTAEMVAVGLEGFAKEFWDIFAKAAGLILCGFFMIKYVPLGQKTIIAATLILFVGNPLTQFLFRSVIPHPDQTLLEADLLALAPVIQASPEVQKNLVVVYLESLERTYHQLNVSKEAFAQFSEFEKAGYAFPNLLQLHSSFFTAGGIVASQCGVPLLPRGVFSARRRIHDKIDVIPEETDFLMGVRCLGDILNEEGYIASYINGSSLSIFSKGAFFSSHGFQRVKGLESYPGYEDEPRTNVWGMDDDLLFERLAEELRWLAGQEKPFVLTTLTLSTHGPDGYPEQNCALGSKGELPLVAAIRCSGAHVNGLLKEIEALGIQDDTLVVLLSDHLAFRNALHSELLAVSDDRRNYVVVLGDEVGVNAREGTLLDVYPTLLELLGFEIEGNRAGLGRSLIGDAPTLVESFGLRRTNRAIKNNADLQRAIWADTHGN